MHRCTLLLASGDMTKHLLFTVQSIRRTTFSGIISFANDVTKPTDEVFFAQDDVLFNTPEVFENVKPN